VGGVRQTGQTTLDFNDHIPTGRRPGSPVEVRAKESHEVAVVAGEHAGSAGSIRATMYRRIRAGRQHHHGTAHPSIAQLMHERRPVMRAKMVVRQNAIRLYRMDASQGIIRRKALDDLATGKASFQRVLREKATVVIIVQHQKCKIGLHIRTTRILPILDAIMQRFSTGNEGRVNSV
jgi:hypothetical protein